MSVNVLTTIFKTLKKIILYNDFLLILFHIRFKISEITLPVAKLTVVERGKTGSYALQFQTLHHQGFETQFV